jgi:transcriptional antiterminator RfaH
MLGKKWYLLTTKPQNDAYAETQLVNQGYDVYRPLAKRIRKRRQKLIEVIESLFPRYLFIQLDTVNDNWAPIRSTRGVAGFVTFGNNPAVVPELIVETLMLNEDELSEKAISLDRFKQGDKVIIESGPYVGLNAVFDAYNGDERAVILLNMLNSIAKLTISPAHLSLTQS